MGLRLVLVLSALWSVAAKLLIQKAAPNFALDAAMPDDSTKTVSLTDFKNKQLGLIAGNVESLATAGPERLVAYPACVIMEC